jgi:hypothetical protein
MIDARRRSPIVDADLFDRAEGRAIVDAAAAVLKGALECDLDCAGLVVPPVGLFDRLLAIREDVELASVLQRHRFTFTSRWTPERRLVEAGRLAERGAAIAVIETRDVPRAAAAIARGGDARRRGLVVIAIDEPDTMPQVPVRRHFTDLGIPVIEPGSLDGLRTAIEHAALLADAADGPAAIVVDESILRTAGVIELRPDRVVPTRDTAAALRRRRAPRAGLDGDLDRLVRRLELDQSVAMPSPGEREVLGIVATGVAATTVRHLLEELRLTGRVPAVFLRLVHPVQTAGIERLLTRCRTVLVIESRPGLVAPVVLDVAESIRARGEPVARIGWRRLPGDGGDAFEIGEASRPSRLVRRLLPLLRELRPNLDLADRLARADAIEVPTLGERSGRGGRGLLQICRRAAISADRILRRGGDDLEPRALAINGRTPTGFKGGVRDVEIIERRRLLEEALPVLASRDGRIPWVLLLVDEGWTDGLDASRILEGTVPITGDATPRVVMIEARDDAVLRDAIIEAVRGDRPVVMVVRRRERVGGTDVEEIDRLGYAPIIRVRSRIDDACGVRNVEDPRVDPSLPRPEDVSTVTRLEQVRGRLGGRWIVRVARMTEIAEIVRHREPLPTVPLRSDASLPAPAARHRGQGRWRAHVAGIRGTTPGAATSVLARAGEAMGFDVHVVTGPSIGMAAWAQVLFTRPLRDTRDDTLCPGIPYGEADLVLGVDPLETIRALGPDPDLRVSTPGRTTLVAQSKVATDERSPASRDAAARLPALAAAACGTSDDRLLDIAARVRQQFGQERLLDVVLLGIAFQRGVVPVTVEAMQTGLVVVERGGFGRSVEAFRFGRMLALESASDLQERSASDPIGRRRREVLLETRMHRGREASRWLDDRIGRALREMPGLLETEAGRRSVDDLLLALARLFRRGGRPLVDEYLGVLGSLHAKDRGDAGRELTRSAVLLLAEAMLPRDAFSLAIAATGLDHRRRLRRRFAVRRARGDRIERTYVARIDLLGFERHLRIDLPVSPWFLGLVARIGRALPPHWRSDRVSRRRREAIERAIDQAASAAVDREAYRVWAVRLRDWASIAAEGRLHDLPPARFETGTK